jgi:hypothetical protein
MVEVSRSMWQRFHMADVTHRQKLWFGRVELFFRCSFQSSCDRVFDVDLALLSFLYDFKCPAAMTILQRGRGANVLRARRAMADCTAHQPHTCRVPLMKVYLEGSDSPTIPSSLARFKQTYFEYGHADRAGSSTGTGSRLFMLNVHMWQYGRPQSRTISVEERHAKLARARQVSGQERRNALLQDRSARRRASLQVSP